MSAAEGRWRLNINIDLDVNRDDDLHEVLRLAVLEIESVLAARRARCGAFKLKHIDTASRRTTKRGAA